MKNIRNIHWNIDTVHSGGGGGRLSIRRQFLKLAIEHDAVQLL